MIRRILIISGALGMFLGAFIGKASGEELSIKSLQVGDKVSRDTMWYFAYKMANKMKKGQRAEVIEISDDKTQAEFKIVDDMVMSDDLTPAERVANAIEKMVK